MEELTLAMEFLNASVVSRITELEASA